MSNDRYMLLVGEVPMAANIWSLVDGANLAKAAARTRPGVEHTVMIDGVDYARYTLLPSGEMRSWVR